MCAKGSGVGGRSRHRHKRRHRQQRLEKPFSERPGAVPAAISTAWALGVVIAFMSIRVTHFTLETAQGAWKATAVYEQGHEHLGWR